MLDLLIVCSVVSQECFKKCLEETLKKIGPGCKWELILTDSKLTLAESYNSIVVTHQEKVKDSKYLVFIGQDIIITGDKWGERLVETLDSLSDLGYAGVECLKETKGRVGCHEDCNDPPEEVTCCDAGIIIIPSHIFLENQFDTYYIWYPFAEDYTCWVRIFRKLKVYHVPIEGFNASGHNCPQNTSYRNIAKRDHEYMLKKWNLEKLSTTTV